MSKSKCDDRPMTWADGRRGKVPKYKYSTLKEIYDNQSNCQSSSYCVYGIVCDFAEATVSRGTDYFALVFLIDDTSQIPLKIRLFHRDINFFAKVDVGDIIRLHRLKVYRGDEVVLCSTRGWSWVQWSKKDDILTSEKASSESYTLTAFDREIVDKLRQWYAEHPEACSGADEKCMRIQEVKHNDHFTLVCQVLNFEEVSSTHIVAKVWDGTKPNILFHHFTDAEDFSSQGIPEGYVVDISIYDDHAEHWRDINISKGNFLKFHNLHAWANRQNAANYRKITCSELSVHPGKSCGRGIEITNDDECLNMKGDMDAAKLFSDCNDNFSQAPSDNCPGPSARSLSQTEDITISNLEEEIVIQDDSESAKENSKQYRSNENKVSQSWILSSCRSDEKESQSSSGANNSQVIRCLQESLTVVSGEAMPLEISDLQNVIEYEVPVNTSKYFRVRANVESCKPNNGTTVVHCCPITGIAFPTTNTGKPLNFTGDVQAFVKIWRKVRGLDSQNTESSCSIIGMDSQSASQWDLPTSQGTNPVKIREYDCQKDGSRWESVEAEKFVVRKRKLNGKTFKILYLLKVEDYGTDRLIQHSSKYDRVIQTVPLSLMLSTSPPAVGIQHGVFYYSCPAYAIPPCLPTLKEEAESFIESRISSTMNCPTLVPRFSLNLTLADGKVKLENVTLASNKAVEFFCGTTPQDYLLNINKVADSIDECINGMVNGPTLLECIIEKKSRKRSNTEDAKPYYIYDICNTSLRC